MEWMNEFLAFPVEQLPFVLITLAIAFSVHEFAHAFFAYRFGDPTAKNEGRVTLNPRKHLDVLGTLFIFLAGFGWAKPVPVNRNNFKHPRLMGIVVSAAGPLSNLLIAFISFLVYYFLFVQGMLGDVSAGVHDAILVFLSIMVNLNIVLFLFNLIPLPPLDGYRIVEDLAPRQIVMKLRQVEQWAVLIFLLLVFIPPLNRMTLQPLFSLGIDIVIGMRAFADMLFA